MNKSNLNQCFRPTPPLKQFRNKTTKIPSRTKIEFVGKENVPKGFTAKQMKSPLQPEVFPRKFRIF